MENNVKILVAYHKPDIIFKNEIVTPIHLGRALQKNKKDKDSADILTNLEKEMIGDDTGDNISQKNSSYNEMTALYWAWKNYADLGDPKYIGFMHYRRHLYVNKKFDDKAYYEINSIKSPTDYIDNVLGLTEKKLLDIFNNYDFIVTKPYYKQSVYDHYKECHDINELDLAVDIINKNFKKYKKSCQSYIWGHNAYFCNMFVFPKDIFMEYCEFVFGVLEEYEKRVDITNKRLFISERLTGIFIQYLIDSGKKPALVPTMYLEESITIPVVMALNKSFVNPTFTALTSMMETVKPSTFYQIYLLVPHEDFEYISKCVVLFRKVYSRCKLKVIDMGSVFSDTKMSITHITAQTYYRLYIPELLPDIKKCLYLDGDIIVKEDLAALFRSNIADFYVGGVRAAGYYYPDSWVEKHTQEVGLPSIQQYINAGVLLMNLDKMRQDNIAEKMLGLVDRGFSSQDQDIINLVCYNKIRILPLQYNFMIKYVKNIGGKLTIDEQFAKIYGAVECENALKAPTIIHYADKIKPWQSTNVIYWRDWFKYYLKSPLQQLRPKRKVSAILPIYNMESYLRECLDSIFSQTLKDIEVICVDDGSNDGSLDILKEYAQKHENLVILQQQNMGVAVARNNGLEIANSEFVCFVDPDDFYPSSDILETLYNKATEHSVKVAGGSWSELLADKTIKTEFVGLNSRYTFKEEKVMNYSDYQFDFGFQRFIYSLDMIKSNKIKFPELTRFQDPPFFIKCMVAANKFYSITMPTYCYRLGHQQPSKWPHKKRNDQILGMIDCLRLSKRYRYATLHNFAYNRLMKEANVFMEEALCGENNYMFELLARAYHAIDIELLSKTIPSVTDRYVLPPLKEVYGKLMYRKNKLGKEMHNLKHSFSYRFSRVLLFIPISIYKTLRCLKNRGLRYTLVRIFRGKNYAHKYYERQQNKKKKRR